MEGVLFLFLTRAGELLEAVTFGLTEDCDESTSSEASATGKAVDAEAQILLPLIRKALCGGAYQEYSQLAHRLNVSQDGAASGQDASTLALLNNVAKSRLQATLMRGCFGDDGGTSHLGPSLSAGSNAADVQKIYDQNSSTHSQQDEPWWFLRELWHLCGWESLLQEN